MQSLPHAEASDEMQEIGNEETFSKSAIMWIDGANLFENAVTIVGFLFITILTIITGINESPAINSQRTTRAFKNSTQQTFSFDAAPISPYNRFLSFDITFIKKDMQKSVSVPVSFTWQVECTGQTKSFNKTIGSFSGDAVSEAGVNDTQHFHLFNDQLIDYQSIELIVRMPTGNLDSEFKGVDIIAKLGANDQTTFQCYFRFVYSCFEFFSLYELFKRYRTNGILHLHTEQKLLIPLIIACLIANYPIYVFQSYYPTRFFFFFEALATSVCEGLIYVSVLTIFEMMRQKNIKIDIPFFMPKFIFCGCVAFTHFIYHFYLAVKAMSPLPVLIGNSTEYALRMFEVILITCFVIWSLVIFVKAVIILDKTEVNKWVMYSFATLFYIAGAVYYNIFATSLSMYEDSVRSVARFVFNNCFVLLMIYYHSAYETLQEQNYIEEGKPQTPADFAEIADPMIDDNEDFDKEENEDEEEEEEEEEE